MGRRDVRFVVDSMLGKLAKWLRMLGYDTLYSRNYEDWQLLRIAEKTKRIIVTRDRGLYWRARRRGLRVVLVESDDIATRLAELYVKAGIRLEADPEKSRCPLCNSELIIVREKTLVKDRVPPESLRTFDKFYVCPRCGKVYWEGSHWRNIKMLVEDAKERVELVRTYLERSKGRSRPS
ncbi:MAG: Mut7-C RNAse domain-containing protein [Desulfurococcales archaeon]|nr:Mut7-C RNAse domain-containing protein [Desulfurococcales archaeon]